MRLFPTLPFSLLHRLMYTSILWKISGLLTVGLSPQIAPCPSSYTHWTALSQQVQKSPHVSKFPPVCTRFHDRLTVYSTPGLAIHGLDPSTMMSSSFSPLKAPVMARVVTCEMIPVGPKKRHSSSECAVK
eukprot:8601461-Pyramimonas_sp.AAC.1